MIKKYYKIKLKLLEPLSVGSGDNQYSDCDIIRDGRGNPFIPGSSLCGAYRECVGSVDADRCFGKKIDPEKNPDEKATNSNVIVYDAKMPSGGSCVTDIRDSVGLDDFKTSIEGDKFDFELVQPGANFVTYIEENINDRDSETKSVVLKKIIPRMCAGDMYLGRKTMRGYGRIQATEVYSRKFVLPDKNQSIGPEEENDLDEWLEFDIYAEDAFNDNNFIKIMPDHKENDSSDLIKLELELQQRGGISIRRYTTELTEDSENQPDYVQLHYIVEEKKSDEKNPKDNAKTQKEIPVIPGTSWGGAFRHHIKELLMLQMPEENVNRIVNKYFGFVKPKKKQENKENPNDNESLKQKSLIRFSESEITGKDLLSKFVTRTAIDRFSGGVAEGAVYTEKTFFNGETSLAITFPKFDGEEDRIFRQAVAASIADLDAGLMAIGGLTAVGRGLFRVTRCLCNGGEVFKTEDTTAVQNKKTDDGNPAVDNISVNKDGSDNEDILSDSSCELYYKLEKAMNDINPKMAPAGIEVEA